MIFFRPTRSDNRPKGTEKAATVRMYPVTTQPKRLAGTMNSSPMAGTDKFRELPIKVTEKEVTADTYNADF
jgi:hypothetical protein